MNHIIYAGKHALTWTVSQHLHKGWELIYCTGGTTRWSLRTGGWATA